MTDIEHKAISNKDGDAMTISGPLTAPGVQVLEELRPELLQVWGIRFGDEVDVVFNAKPKPISMPPFYSKIPTSPRLASPPEQSLSLSHQCPAGTSALSFFAPSVMPWALRGHLVMSPNYKFISTLNIDIDK